MARPSGAKDQEGDCHPGISEKLFLHLSQVPVVLKRGCMGPGFSLQLGKHSHSFSPTVHSCTRD